MGVNVKLQLALDDISIENACELLSKISSYIDIIEIGTPLIIEEGMKAVHILKNKFPDKEILADLKIMDAGYYEAEIAFKAGADYTTVLGVTDIETIKDCLKAADDYQGEVIADMICVEKKKEKISELEAAGVRALAVHTGVDQQVQGRTALEDLKELCKYRKNAKIFVAGGLNSLNISQYIAERPDVLIVGGGICHAADPLKEAQEIVRLIKECG